MVKISTFTLVPVNLGRSSLYWPLIFLLHCTEFQVTESQRDYILQPVVCVCQYGVSVVSLMWCHPLTTEHWQTLTGPLAVSDTRPSFHITVGEHHYRLITNKTTSYPTGYWQVTVYRDGDVSGVINDNRQCFQMFMLSEPALLSASQFNISIYRMATPLHTDTLALTACSGSYIQAIHGWILYKSIYINTAS